MGSWWDRKRSKKWNVNYKLRQRIKEAQDPHTSYVDAHRVDCSYDVAKCLQCQQVKVEHRHPIGLLQPHTILESKWEVILMDFIVGLPLLGMRHDLIFCGTQHPDEECSFYSCAYDVSGT